MKKVFLFLSLFLVSAFLVGCFEPKNIVSSIEVVSDETEFDQGFELSDLDVKVTMSDGTFSLVPLNESMLSADDLAKFQEEGTHTIAVSYLNAATTFTISITGEKGDPGVDGKEILLQVAEGYIQWQYEGDTTWTNLIALEALMGTSGTDGTPTTFRVDSGFIQWQYVGDTTWTNLLATADLIGLTGATGPAGANGADGKQIVFQVTADFIQWQYVGDTTWTDLIALSALKGPAGVDGITPTIGISEDGYWVINGVKTTYKASGESVAPVLLNVTFDPMGGTLPEGTPAVMTNVEKGSTIILPVPTNNGLIFEGWWTGDTVNDGKFTNATPVTKDITLYARWKTDYVPIETFLAIPTTTNFTADSLMVAEFVWGTMAGKFENTMNFKIYEEAGIIYTYENSTEKSFQNGVEDPEGAHYFEGFNAYKQNQTFSLHRNELAGKWEIGVFEDTYESDFPLGFIDSHKFVKRIGVNIYDYPLTDEELLNLTQDMDMGGKVIPSSAHCYLDLDAHKLVIAFNMEQMMEDGTKMTGSVSMEIVLTNPGLTTIELPLADTKTAALEMIDQVAASREEINFAKPESAQLFNDLVAQIKAKVSAAVSILELIDILPVEIPKIHMFYFEIDNLAQEKFYKIEQMTGYLESKKMLATADSILAMVAIHDTDVALLQSAISFEQINQIFNEYFGKIDAAYVVDEAKVQLVHYIDEQTNILSFYQNVLSQYLATMQDHEKVNGVVQNYVFLMQKALTIADVDLLFAQAITELKALQLAWEPTVIELPNQLIPYFTDTWESIKPIIGENPILEAQMNAIIDAIKAEPNPLLQVDKFVVGYLQFRKDVTALVKTFALNKLEELKNYFAEIVVPEDYDQLMDMYNQAVIEINARQDFWEIMNVVNQFESDAEYLQLDPVKQTIAYLIENLLQELVWFSETATADSIVAMQTVVDTNIPLIEASTTVEQAEANYYVAFQALEAAYVMDPLKQALLDAIFETENDMLDLLDFLNQLILPVVMDEAWILFDTFSAQLHNVTTIAELDVIYNEWYAKIQLLDLTAGEYPLIQMRKEILDYANELREIIITTVDPLPLDFEANFTAFVTMVNSTTNALILYNQGNPYIEGLQALAIEAFRADFLLKLQDQLYYYASLVLDSELPTLQAKYDAFVIRMNEAIDQWEIENILYEFMDFASGLEQDPIKANRMSFINSAHFNLQQLLETANAESSLALVALFDAFIVDINALVDYSEMNTRYYELMDAYDAAFIPDYDKVTLIFTKNECMSKLYQFVGEYVQQVALEPDYAYTLYQKIDELSHTIFDATTVTEVYAACTNIMTIIDVPFPIDTNRVEPYRDGIIETIYYEFNNLYSYLELIPATLANEYFAVLGNLEIAVTPGEIFNHYTTYMSNLNSQLFGLIKAEHLALALQYKEEFALIVTDANIPLIEPAYLQCVEAINHANEIFDIYNATDRLYYLLSSLEMDYFKQDIVDAKYYAFSGIENLLSTATAESLVLMQAEISSYTTQIEAATTSEEAWNIATQAYGAIAELYVRDFAIYNLQVLKEHHKSQLVEYVYTYFYDLYLNWDLYFPIKNVQMIYDSLINEASTPELVDFLYQEAMNKFNLYPFDIDGSLVPGFINNLVSEFNDFCYWELLYLNELEPELESIIDNAKTTIQNATSPLDAMLLFFGFRDQVRNIVFNQFRIQQLAMITADYNYYHSVIADADVPALEAAYATLQNSFGLAIDNGSLDFASQKLYMFMNDLPIDALKLEKYNRIYDLNYYYDSLVRTATADSITALAAALATHTANIQNATTSEDVETAYNAGLAALDAAYVEDPDKALLVEAQDAAINDIYNYVNFMQGFISEWEIHHQMWDMYNTYSNNIYLATDVTQVQTLLADAFVQMAAIEVLDNITVSTYRDQVLISISDEYNAIVSPTQEQTDTFNNYYGQIQTAVHPYTINTLENEYYNTLNPTV